MMTKENKLDTMIKTEKRTNAQKLKIKEIWFLIMSECAVLVNPCILTTPAFRLIEEDFKSAIQVNL